VDAVTSFTLYPAIDLKDGRCVRLLRGEMDAATVFNDDPAEQTRRFARDGFAQLHVVDLNGAFEGRSANAAAVRAILAAATVPVQLGGGVRDLDAVGAWLKLGVSRVILGTAAVRDPELVRQAARSFPGQVAVGVDAREGKVATHGWAETSDVDAVDLARRMEDMGVAALIVTDIARDGAMLGVNVEAVGEVADAVAVPVIASGGVSSADDIRALRARPGRPIAGAIIGRALYEGALSPRDALSAAS
jgi:phosphoribosylformimino-5-aminoimidazole carboxamide ribotide isomerase